MENNANPYRLMLKQVLRKPAASQEPAAISFGDDDDIFTIIDHIKRKHPFGDVHEETQFIIGLKMFSEVMMDQNGNPYFEDLLPSYKTFLQKLKAI